MGGPKLNLWWRPRERQAQADDARSLARFVNGLPAFDPIYESWLDSPKTRKTTVPVPLSEAAAKQLLIDTITRYDVGNAPWPELGSNVWGGHAGPPLTISVSRTLPAPGAPSAILLASPRPPIST